MLYGIVQGGVYPELRAESLAFVANSGVTGIAIGGSLGKDKEQMTEVVGWVLKDSPDSLPRHLLGVGDVDDLVAGVRDGVDTFDCATPTRLGRHGTALVQDPEARWRMDLTKPAFREDARPIDERCPCPACGEHTRAYLHYLSRAKEITSARLVTLHNLTFMKLLMDGIRQAIVDGRFEQHAQRVLAGEEPFGG
jgi:queuine tRNA-ribosyltransferase